MPGPHRLRRTGGSGDQNVYAQVSNRARSEENGNERELKNVDGGIIDGVPATVCFSAEKSSS